MSNNAVISDQNLATRILRAALALGGTALVINEIRGLILAAPILYGMAEASTLMALWVGFCSLVGIAASVLVPAIVWRKLNG